MLGVDASEPVARLDGAADLVAEQRHYVVGQCLEAAEIRFAARIQITFAAQGVDQGAEQLLVEELGGVDAVQGAEAFRHHQAVRFQLLRLDVGLGQHAGQHDGVALQGLLDAFGQEQQAHLVAGVDPVAAVAGLDQLLAQQLGQQGIDQFRQLVLFAAQEEFGLEQGVDVDTAGDDLAAEIPSHRSIRAATREGMANRCSMLLR